MKVLLYELNLLRLLDLNPLDSIFLFPQINSIDRYAQVFEGLNIQYGVQKSFFLEDNDDNININRGMMLLCGPKFFNNSISILKYDFNSNEHFFFFSNALMKRLKR